MFNNRKLLASFALIFTSAFVLTSCSNDSPEAASTSTSAAAGTTTISNCGQEVSFPADPSLLVHDSGIVSIALAAGTKDNIQGVTVIGSNRDIMAAKFGEDTINSLNLISEDPLSLEQIVALQPDVFVAGWNYGFNESAGLTPELLEQRGIGSYLLTESCRQEGTTQRGIVEPWEALDDDLRNLSELAGDPKLAEDTIADTKDRLAALNEAPQAEETPTVFLFDSGSDTIFTSGRFGAPQAIIEAAGARNQTENIDDTWTTVGWEVLAAQAPDVIAFVDYEGQSFEDKVALLKANPVTRDLPAVQENRFINLNYAMWVSSPLNVDAAEIVRKAMERFQLVPESTITPALELPASLPGREYLVD